MLKIAFHPGEGRRYLLAIIAGLLLAISFPKVGVAGMAWIAPGFMLAAAMGCRGGAAFRLGYVAGLAHYLASLYWLLLIPVKFAPVVGWLLLGAFLALYPATWVWLCWKVYPAKMGLEQGQAAEPAPGSQTNPASRPSSLAEEDRPARRSRQATERQKIANVSAWNFSGVISVADQFLSNTWLQRFGWTFCCAALWVTWEMVQARFLSGFPWNFLGASQYEMLPLIQIASFTGVYGLSFLVCWFSVSLLGAGAAVIRQSGVRRAWAAEIMVPLFVAVGVVGYGWQEVLRAPTAQATLKIALVQPSIPQTVIWDPKAAADRFEQLMQLSEKALTNKPDLLVWPEAAVPSIFLWDTNQVYHGQTIYEATTGLARRHQVWLIMGADDIERNAQSRDEVDFFNSSFLISPGGEVLDRYRKQRLVIFGEYVPLSRWLPFLKDFTHVYGEFTPGKKPVTFQLPDLRVKTAVLICFEDVFPHLARKHVEPDTDFLLNLTNNGWFGESAAQWQHAATAVFRAVENGLPLVRAANNGLSCWVDAKGRLHDVYFHDTKNIYQAGYKIVQVPLASSGARSLPFYTRHGDWFGWGCVGFAALKIASWLAYSRSRTRYCR